jgi:hypothetical protein
MAKQLGTDDSVNTCDCCGKTGLKFTFAVELDSGEVVHYGSTCVTRHTGRTRAQIESEGAQREAVERGAKERIFRATPEAHIYDRRMSEAHALQLIGKAFKEFCTAAREAADRKRAEIYAA